MSELTPEQLANLFPGVDPKNIKVLDINNLSQSDIYSLRKNIRIYDSLSASMAYDSFTEGVYKFEKFISIDPEIVQDKNIKIVGVGTWKEKPENEYEEGFEVLTRMNPLLYQLNSDNFLNHLPDANIIWDINDGTGDKWPKLCLENFNNLIGKEIYVREITLEKNNQGQDAYRIDWIIL